MILKKIKNFFELVKFEHTIFALPFAYAGAILSGGENSLSKWILITLAMVGARTAGMSLNRLIDLKYDRANPRTANRTLPGGRMKLPTVLVIITASLGLFLFSAYSLNFLCFILSPVALLLLFSYSYLKRFTSLCHVALGLTLACSPVGGWIAMTGRLEMPPVLIGIAVMFWVAGFDIIYACQDYTFDSREKLFSIPVRFGLKRALQISCIFHVITVVLLFYAGLLLRQNIIYYLGVIIVAGLLVYEHLLVGPEKTDNIHRSFFVVNSWISEVLFAFVLVSKLWKW